MNICASYHTDAALLDEIRYTAATLDAMVEKAIDVPDKLYILEIVDLVESHIPQEKLESLIDELSNIVVDCYNEIDFLKLAVKHPYKVMYHYPYATFNELKYASYVKPYAVTLGEPLTFCLTRVKTMLENTKIKIRVVPTIGRPSNWNIYKSEDTGIAHFWITPQMLPLYAPYIDTIDLYDQDPGREKALVGIYQKRDTAWPLSVLFKNCDVGLGAYMFDEEFVTRRLNCGQTCMEGRCHYCERTAAAMNTVLRQHIEEQDKTEYKYLVGQDKIEYNSGN